VTGSALVPRHGPPRVPVPPPGHMMRVFAHESFMRRHRHPARTCPLPTNEAPRRAAGHRVGIARPGCKLLRPGCGPLGPDRGPLESECGPLMPDCGPLGPDCGAPYPGRPSSPRNRDLIAVRQDYGREIESKSARGRIPLYDKDKPENLSGQNYIYAAFWVFGAFRQALHGRRSARDAGGPRARPGARSGRADRPRPAMTEDHAWPGPFAGPGHARDSVCRDLRREVQAFMVSAVSPVRRASGGRSISSFRYSSRRRPSAVATACR